MVINNVLKKVLKLEKIDTEKRINKIEMDSRKVGKGDVFFAISGGNNFVKSTLENDPFLIIYDNPNINVKDDRAILVEDTTVTMQKIAREYIRNIDTRVIGITGTNGKTSTKDIIYAILKEKFKVIKSQGNYNNHIGLPFTILQIKESDELAVLEMGMSSFGEIDLLCDIASIDYGIITNIGESHLEFLKTVENVFKAKGEMLNYLDEDKRFLFGDDMHLKKVSSHHVGLEAGNDEIISSIKEDEEGVTFLLDGDEYRLEINGYYNAINAGLAIALAKSLGMEKTEIKKGLLNASLSSMRYEKTQKENKLYINDAYNADPLSMKSSIKSFDKLYNDTYKIAVLGDMLELGENSKKYHSDLKVDIEEAKIDKVLLFGEEMRSLSSVCKNNSRVAYFENKQEIVKYIEEVEGKVTILLKGSRGMKLEEIII